MAMYQTPSPRRKKSSSPVVPDGPIADLTKLIEDTVAEDWQRRVSALESIVHMIPDGSAYLNSTGWYNTPKTLCHLHYSVSELIKDPRSTVVRRVCSSLTILFRKCQSDARLLFKALMTDILIVHAQTVQVIRQSVQSMVMEAIPEVPCKSVMPLWMERLKDKSPAVRDACCLYLGLALKSWTDEGYLTDEIYLQVGNCLLRSMRDPSPTVRKHSKNALLYLQNDRPQHMTRIQNDPSGPAANDPKLKRWLRNLGNDNIEDLSIASKYTFHSESRFARARVSSPRVKLANSLDDDDSGPFGRKAAEVPFSIQVTTKDQAPIGLTSSSVSSSSRPPKAAPFSHVTHTPREGTPPRPPGRTMSPQVSTYTSLAVKQELEHSESSTNHTDLLQAANEIFTAQNPFIQNLNELKQHASRRRSRNSVLMVERFKSQESSSVLSEKPTNEPATPPQESTDDAPEHIVVAIRLLRAHKQHVDQIMETLKIEMDTLRDFDKLLEEPGRPLQDELLTYYESVDLCLEQRLQAGLALRTEMDKISSGEPP